MTGRPCPPESSPRAVGRDGRLALFLPSLGGGGAEAMMLVLARGLVARGHPVDIVVCKRQGALLERVPAGAQVVELSPAPSWIARLMALAADPARSPAIARLMFLTRGVPQRIRYLPGFVSYLRTARPQAVLSALTLPNLIALWARQLAGVPTRVVVSQRNTLSQNIEGSEGWHRRLRPVLRRLLPTADAIVAISEGVADDLAAWTRVRRDRIDVIYNPVATAELEAKQTEPLAHPWFFPGAPPIVLGVGRLVAQKDFPTLIRAFAEVRARREARLVILGGRERPTETRSAQAALRALAGELGVGDEVCLAGFVANPLAYMARAAVFVLSSRYEGFGNVLVEALACGCPVVSTDCPHGPREILQSGAYGRLVPVGDVPALAEAIVATLDSPHDRIALRRRACEFGADAALDRYLRLLVDGTHCRAGRPDGAGPRGPRT